MLNAKNLFLATLLWTLGVGDMVASAQEGQWRVAKVSGEAWIGAAGPQPASLTKAPTLRPGDTVRTGHNGRVLLVRGAESILVSANSSISLPEAGRAGMTTVIQQAGTILLDVEKRNVQHFEVETPYLAAVVKGTQFRVSLREGRAQVNVTRGQVQVSDFRSGQFALVMPGQSAQAFAGGAKGLQLSGQGTFSPVQQGAPQAPRVAPLPVPKRGLSPLPGAVQLQRAGTPAPAAIAATRPSVGPVASGVHESPGGRIRISAPIGEINLDILKVTRGMARGDLPAAGNAAPRATVWNTGELNPGNGNSKNKAVNNGTPAGTVESSAGASGAAASTRQTGVRNGGVTTAQGNGGGNNGNAGSNAGGKGSDSGNSGNGTGNSGNGNSGNGSSGNGNSGNDNPGNGNSGNGNSGNGNSGNGNGSSGNGNSGNGNSGNGNGSSGNGNGNSGNGNSGNGNGNSGNGNSGNGNAGTVNSGNGNGNSGNGNKN